MSAQQNEHALAADVIAASLKTDCRAGLDDAEAASRLAQHGPNRLTIAKKEPWWREALEELTEPMILLLLAVGVVYAVLGEFRDAMTILVIIVAVLAIELTNEARAKGAIAALRRLAAPTAPVIRGGQPVDVRVSDIVPGDVVRLSPGERVPADLRLVDTAGLQIDESSLTGESAPASKNAAVVLSPETVLADRQNMAFAGTLVTSGRGLGVVVGTGMQTELGRIAGMVAEAREPRTPLQQHMRQLSAWLVWVALGFSLLVPLLGWLAGLPLRDMVLTGLTLAFATIPEELPILITMVLGLGGYRLARQNAVAKRLKAIETLGAVTVIATDKTGTLTQNRMTVTAIETAAGRITPGVDDGGDAARLLWETAVLANNATSVVVHQAEHLSGDPTETALLAAAGTAGLSVGEIRAAALLLTEYPFDADRKMMATVHRLDEGIRVSAKGAPESILSCCDRWLRGQHAEPLNEETRRYLLARAEHMATEGLRVLGFAYRTCDLAPSGQSEAETGLVFLGVAGLIDPPRPEVRAAVDTLRSAGIRVVMLTGDHPETARAIAQQVGIEQAAIFARIAPEHKLSIVRALQEQGELVAVTGDGVNDAPALKEAAVGMAMGVSGTDVAKEAADIVLADDNFATMANAVHEGRRLYANLRKAVRYYLAAKVALVLASLVAVLFRVPLPFAPIQIILTELFMDLGAALAFTVERAESNLMAHPPRDQRTPFLDRSMQAGILGGGLSLATAVMAAYLYGWYQGNGLAHAQTLAFVTWMIGHLVLALHMRTEREPVSRLGVWTNRALLGWAGVAVLFTLSAVFLPGLRPLVRTASLSASDWAVVMAAGLFSPVWMELSKWWRWRAKN